LSASWRSFMLAITSIMRSSNSSLSTYISQLTIHTDSHASYSGTVRWQWRTILGAQSKLLYSEIAVSRKPHAIGHTYIYTFCLELPMPWPPRLLTFPPGTCCISKRKSQLVVVYHLLFNFKKESHYG
jgi:hypothetical protein